jgi:hypothetical protein
VLHELKSEYVNGGRNEERNERESRGKEGEEWEDVHQEPRVNVHKTDEAPVNAVSTLRK